MNQPTKPDSIETECRANCDICFDEVGNEWPCAKQRAIADRAARQPVAGSVDTPEFQALAEAWRYAPAGTREFMAAWENLIAHINALIAPAAPSGEAVAWATSDGKECVSAESKRWMEGAGFGVWSEAAAKYVTPLYTRPAPRDVDAPIVLPEKPKPQCLLPGVYAHTDDTLDNFATAAVQKDRADWKETK